MQRFVVLILFSLVLGLSGSLQAQSTQPASPNSKMLNPDISANILGLYRNSNRGNDAHSESPNGFSIQEVELQFSADIDPFFRANALIAIHPEAGHSHGESAHAEEEHAEEEHAQGEEHEEHAEEEEGHSGFHVEPEEAFIETIALPLVTVKAGKFKAALGKHNTLHTHAYPFIDAPLTNQKILGHEGLNDVGVSLSGLLPMPWFSEVTVQGIENNSDLFGSDNANETVAVARWRNLFEVTDDLTFDLGVSGARGKNPQDKNTTLSGADVTFKWRPSEGGKYVSFLWTTEYLQVQEEGLEVDEKRGGVASWAQVQFMQRWWAGARVEKYGIPSPETFEAENKQSYLIGFFPSEFSGFRLQYDRLDDGAEKPEERLSLQMNISIGAHPAHAY